MSFLDLEREFVRRFVPDFEWVSFPEPTSSAPLKRPVRAARVALVTTSGAYVVASQPPFQTRNPMGDDSYRIIPNTVSMSDVSFSHPGYDTQRALQDKDCVFPLALLRTLQEKGEVGEVAPRHFSFMGYIPKPERLIRERAPEVGRLMHEDEVDLAILVPS